MTKPLSASTEGTITRFFGCHKSHKKTCIRICVHVILGLPGETREDMMETAEAVAGLGIQGIKLHHLYVAKKYGAGR